MSGEQTMWREVVLMALADASNVDAVSGVDRLEQRRADAWIRGNGEEFRAVVSLAGWDPEFIRDAHVSGRVDRTLLRTANSRGIHRPREGGPRIGAVDKIATLESRAEIEGWKDEVRQTGRAWEPGEVAALAARERAVRR